MIKTKPPKDSNLINILEFCNKKVGNKFNITKIGNGVIGEIDEHNDCFYFWHNNTEYEGSKGMKKPPHYSYSVYLNYNKNQVKAIIENFKKNFTVKQLNNLLSKSDDSDNSAGF